MSFSTLCSSGRTLFAGLVAALVCVSCSREKEPSAALVQAQARRAAPELRAWADWYTAFLNQAYRDVGKRNPAWDNLVTNAFRAIAQGRAAQNDAPDWRATVVKLTRGALDQGCTDPLVQYFNVRFSYADPTRPDPAVRPALTNAAIAVRDSTYPMLLRFWASASAATGLKGTSLGTTEEVAAWDTEAASFLNDALDANPPLPAPEAEAAAGFLFDLVWGHPQALPVYWRGLAPKLESHYGETAWFHRLEGSYHHQRAWHIRGDGWAKEVPKDAWKSFQEELEKAEKSFQQAWSLDPTSTATALWMLDLCVSAGKPRADMEKWFQRAMTLAPGNFTACRHKLRYLSPRWYGSAHEVLAFARQCITNTSYQPPAPLLIGNAYRDLAGLLENDTQRAEFFQQPALWSDLQTAVAEMERRQPGSPRTFHELAWFAWYSQRWDDFHTAFEKIEVPDPEFFGGEKAYAQMLDEARRHPPTTPATAPPGRPATRPK